MALLEQWQQYAEEQQNGPKGMKFWEEYLYPRRRKSTSASWRASPGRTR